MKIDVHMLSQSKPVTHTDVDNAYTKDGLYCIYYIGGVLKYPMINIFRIKEYAS